MFSYWAAFPAGIVIAMISSIVGIGGGILWMPFLLIALKLTPEISVLTSLAIQTVGMGSGGLAYLRQKRVDLRLTSIMLAATAPGVMIGARLTGAISPKHTEMIIGLLAMATAFLFVSSNRKYDNQGDLRAETGKTGKYLPLISLMAVFSGMLSVSIGEWIIPLMHNKMNLRMSTAIATSVMTIFGVCLLGVLFHLGLGHHPCWQALAWAAPGVLLGGQLGPAISERINERLLKEIFIFFLTLVGIHLIYNAF
ncbi:MAG TPA: sulfite exporter TauE/SafE family protein [Proteobacteria bacterium]|nr:sulfite exporter TauE/SafE family protein [Pseudomonadota bacterium]